MTQSHKNALAAGRSTGRVVRSYLEALHASKPKRGRKRTPDSVARRIAMIDGNIAKAAPLQRLLLIQERHDLTNELALMEAKVDISELEEAFVEVAAEYGARKGISYASWRELNVPAAVLKAAGIGRGA
jgi:hypothetical protein